MLCLVLALSCTVPAAPTPPLRRECFVLEGPLVAGEREALGWAEFLRRENEHGSVLECEYVFVRPKHDERWRVRHVEQLDEASPKLVWREIGTAAGRTLTLERARAGSNASTADEWRSTAYERNEVVRTSLDTRQGAVFPLYLLELGRAGQLATGDLWVFDPLEGALAARRATTLYQPASGSRARTLEFTRPDGTLAGRWVFEGAELVSFQWQEGGPLARRIPPEKYTEAVRNQADLPAAPPH